MPKPPATARLAESYAALVAEGSDVTVRALRERARCTTEAARQWLQDNRPDPTAGEAPLDVLAAAFAPVWSAAVTAARADVADTHDRQLQAAATSEADALGQVEKLTDELAAVSAEAEAATAQVQRLVDEGEHRRIEMDRLAGQLAELQARADASAADAERRLDSAEARADAADARARTAEERAHAAQLKAQDAEATARTLRTVLETLGHRREGQ
ncbi:hypothetical protein [Gordonia sihwensis]|uniref:hypothetical protein n=1 Tax=Gordonia sihwensis TaxID=173559 RepID=UPI0005EE8A5C|nr:hypothetical protein [Gordonia sihwensis]KJR10288.1 hypothetical protein UG54_01545 [Gordonia sihwensis]